MKIVDKSLCEETMLDNLDNGEIFKYGDRIFMKVSPSDEDELNVYDFSKGRLTDLSMNTIVRRIPSELILHGSEWSEE